MAEQRLQSQAVNWISMKSQVVMNILAIKWRIQRAYSFVSKYTKDVFYVQQLFSQKSRMHNRNFFTYDYRTTIPKSFKKKKTFSQKFYKHVTVKLSVLTRHPSSIPSKGQPLSTTQACLSNFVSRSSPMNRHQLLHVALLFQNIYIYMHMKDLY